MIPAFLFRRSVWLGVVGAITAVGAFVYWTSDRAESTKPVPVAAVTQPLVADVAPEPIPSVPVIPSTEIIVQRNDTMDRIFRRLELSITDLASVRALPGIRQALDMVRPGDAITVMHEAGVLHGLMRQISDTETIQVKRELSGFTVKVIENPLEKEVKRQYGRITSSLFEAAATAGISDQTAMTMTSIFGWDIDFVLEVREGDEFTVIYEGLWQDGQYVRDGNILAAEFINNGRVVRAVRYERPDGTAEYFTPDGRSMRKAFLRAPLEFTRVSSRFNPNRRHPVLNTIRAHKGVDYAAPTGTPVRAAGNGRVELRGRHGGYGNAIVLEHGGGVTTLYGHLSRFAPNVRQGGRVHQGQIIGYVGQTGLASGPHLHYEYRLNGVHRNPQTVPLPNADPISKELLADFTLRTKPLLAQLDKPGDGPRLAQK